MLHAGSSHKRLGIVDMELGKDGVSNRRESKEVPSCHSQDAIQSGLSSSWLLIQWLLGRLLGRLKVLLLFISILWLIVFSLSTVYLPLGLIWFFVLLLRLLLIWLLILPRLLAPRPGGGPRLLRLLLPHPGVHTLVLMYTAAKGIEESTMWRELERIAADKEQRYDTTDSAMKGNT